MMIFGDIVLIVLMFVILVVCLIAAAWRWLKTLVEG